MPHSCLGEGAPVAEERRDPFLTPSGVETIDEIGEQIQANVLGHCHAKGQSALVDRHPLLGLVEDEVERRPVQRVDCKTGRTGEPAAVTSFPRSATSE